MNYKGIGWLMHLGFTQDSDGKWNYDGDENIKIEEDSGLIKDGKFYVEFGKIKSNFDCSGTTLTSLKGAPSECKVFSCSRTNIKVLDFIPVAKSYWFAYGLIERIDYPFPEKVEDIRIMGNRNLSSFNNFPKELSSLFINNCGFKSLEGTPKTSMFLEVCGNDVKSLKGLEDFKVHSFNASNCNLKSLEYCPDITSSTDLTENKFKNLIGIKGPIVDSLMLSKNPNLESVEGIEKQVSQRVALDKSGIRTLEHMHRYVGRIFCPECPNLEKVYFEASRDGSKDNNDIYVTIEESPNLNMYEFFKMGFKSNVIKKPTLGQLTQFNYRDTMENLHGHPIKTMTEVEYYNDLFKYLTHDLSKKTEEEKEKIIERITSINWCEEIVPKANRFTRSHKRILKFSL